jgi:nucleotide-binding universal stress UspA family protein
MAHSLSDERQEEVGLSRQKAMHEAFIDEGLGVLYRTFLEQARTELEELEIDCSTVLLQGKAYQALVDYLEGEGADLVVLGRYGYHQENISQIGSNAEAVARQNRSNVLITAPRAVERPVRHTHKPTMKWEPDAFARLERIPIFVRSMIKRRVEDRISATGENRVTLETFQKMTQHPDRMNSRRKIGRPAKRGRVKR